MAVGDLRSRFYGDPKYDGTKLFYDWIRQYTSRSTHLLNVGAGPATKSSVRSFKGEIERVTGIDIDPAVLQNDELDESRLIVGGDFPFEDGTFDVVFSDYVLEHVEHPQKFVAEVHRVLKPGASFFFRTPNLWHYVALVSAMTPQRFHDAVANRVRMLPADQHPPYPTFYRMNRPTVVSRLARDNGFRNIELRMVEMEPSYLAFNSVAFLLGTAYERTVNSSRFWSSFRANMFGRFSK